MIFFFSIFMKKQEASALLSSVVIMSLVMGSALIFYRLVMQDVALFRSWKSESQLHYAHEGMKAWALSEMRGHSKGYEPQEKSYRFEQGVEASFVVEAMGASTPCLEDEHWAYLESQASVHQPLYYENASGEIQPIHDFLVEFFLVNASGQSVRAQGPILRWKILGMEKMKQETQAISEFMSLDLGNDRFREDNPSVFGPGYEGSALPSNYTHAKFFQLSPQYTYYEAYPIQDFLQRHDWNTLILTNALGPDYAGYRLAYRVKSKSGEVVCPQAKIRTKAVREDQKTEKEWWIPYAESLPVFDFVLYHTEE